VIGYRAPAVQKAFQLLERVAASENGIRLSKVSQDLGFSKSTTHGLIQALLAVGALDRSPHQKRLFLGPSIMDMAFKSKNYYTISKEAMPILDGLCRRIGETVFLGVLSDSKGVILASARASKALAISSSPGDTIPIFAGAVGKAYLASLSDKEALGIIRKKGLPRYTPCSIVDEKAYLKALNRVLQDGYALDNEEYLAGVRAMAVNLGIHRGLPLLIWVVGFADSMSEDTMAHIIRETLDAAETLKLVFDAEK